MATKEQQRQYDVKFGNSEKGREYKRNWMRTHSEFYRLHNQEKRKTHPHITAVVRARARAKKEGMDCDLDNDWANEHYNGKCELTGEPFAPVAGDRNLKGLSLDRKDNSKGYTKDNCRFVLLGVNLLRNQFTDKDMLEIAQLIVKAFN